VLRDPSEIILLLLNIIIIFTIILSVYCLDHSLYIIPSIYQGRYIICVKQCMHTYIVYLIIYYLAIPEVPSHFYVKYYVSQNIFKKNASYMVHLSN